MWTPTHVQVTVLRARNLIPKGKSGTNDAYVTITVAKDKYQTSVKEKSENPEWHEECDLPIPEGKATILLNAHHRNLLGLDEFLGHTAIPLDQFQIYERPRARWYPLKNKAGSKKAEKYRGEIEVKVTFIVQSLSSSELNLAKSQGKFKRAGSSKSLLSDKLKFPTKGNLFRQGSKSDLYADKKQPFPQEPVPVSPHETMATVFQSQEVLPTEFRAPSPEGGGPNDHKISNLERERYEASRESQDGSSPKLFKRPLEAARVQQLKQQLGEDATQPSLSSSTNSLTREYPRQCRSITTERRHTLVAQSMLDLSSSHLGQSPGTSPNMPHHTSDLHRTASNASSKSDDDEFSRFNRKRQPVLRSSQKGKRPASLDASSITSSSPPGRSGLSLDALDGDRRSSTHSNDSSQAHTLGSLPEESSSRDNTPLVEMKPLPHSPPPSDSHASLRPLAEQIEHIEPSEIPLEDKKKKRKSLTEIEKKENERNATESTPVKKEEVSKREMSKKTKDDLDMEDLEVSRRHTMGFQSRVVGKVAAHELHEMASYKKPKETSVPREIMDQYEDFSREELIQMVVKQKKEATDQDRYVKDMEDYIDRLLVKVMETDPKILQNPFEKAQQQLQQQQRLLNSSPLNNRTVEMTRNNTSIIHPNLTSSLKITNSTTPKIMNVEPSKKPVKATPAKNTGSKKSANPFKKLQAALK